VRCNAFQESRATELAPRRRRRRRRRRRNQPGGVDFFI
jgi:hypothetical protein